MRLSPLSTETLPIPDRTAASTGRTLQQTNAAIYRLAHCVSLLSRCLGLLLPFLPHLGATPSIVANRSRAWTTRCVCGSGSQASANARRRFPQQQTLAYDPAAKQPAESTPSSQSATVGLKPLVSSFTSFLTGYTMLLYDLAYICNVQGLPVDLASAIDVIPALLSLSDAAGQVRCARRKLFVAHRL